MHAIISMIISHLDNCLIEVFYFEVFGFCEGLKSSSQNVLNEPDSYSRFVMHDSSTLNLNISGTMMSMNGHGSNKRGTGMAKFEEDCPVVFPAKII